MSLQIINLQTIGFISLIYKVSPYPHQPKKETEDIPGAAYAGSRPEARNALVSTMEAGPFVFLKRAGRADRKISGEAVPAAVFLPRMY